MDKYYKLIKLFPTLPTNWEIGMILIQRGHTLYVVPVLTKYTQKNIESHWLQDEEFFVEVSDTKGIERVYRFYIDRKQTMWVRDFYNINATSYKEAHDIVTTLYNEADDDLYFSYRDTLYDTAEDIPVSKEHIVTKECYTEDGELIISNELK